MKGNGMKKEVNNYHCGNCKYFRVDADRNESLCKRIDHKSVKFHTPWFKSYDCNQHNGIICSDFIPASWYINAVKEWNGFEEYWENYVEQWLPYKKTDTTVSFIINGDRSVSYQVKLLDFIYNTMFDEYGYLKAVSKRYYKRDKTSSIGYRLITEKVDIPVIVSK